MNTATLQAQDQRACEPFSLFCSGSRISIQWDEHPPGPTAIVRVCSITPERFVLLDHTNVLFYGTLDGGGMSMQLRRLRNDVVDVQYSQAVHLIYIVTDEGAVFTQGSGDSFTGCNWHAVLFDPLELSEEGVHILRVCCSATATLFVSTAGDIYATGNCGAHFSVECTQPKLVRLFKQPVGLLDISAGDQFFVFLTSNHKQSFAVKNSYGELPDVISSETCRKHVSSAFGSTSQSSHGGDRVQSNIHNLLEHGSLILNSEIHTLGADNKGLLGSGDHIKRESVISLQKIKNIGVCSLATGREHTVVRTIDGRLYHWGINNRQQLSPSADVFELSSPTEVVLDSSDADAAGAHILAACCGDFRTVLLTMQGDLLQNDERFTQQEQDFLALQMPTATNLSYPLLLASNNLTVYNHRPFRRSFQMLHCHLQCQLKSMIGYRKRFCELSKLMAKAGLSDIRNLCQLWENVLHLLVSIVSSSEQFYRCDLQEASQLVVIKYHRECITIFECYTKSYCDMYCVDGLMEIQHLSQGLVDSTAGTSPSVTLPKVDMFQELAGMFQKPLNIVPHIIQLLEQIHKSECCVTEELAAWMELARQNRIETELADNTLDFWRSSPKKVLHFKRKERRVILSSLVVPLKVSQSLGRSSSCPFVLFSDFLCQITNHVICYPLNAIWLAKEDSGIRIVTPEKNFLLLPRNEHDKELWFDQLGGAVKTNLRLCGQSEIPDVRCIEYLFSSNNQTYPGVFVKGYFALGVMHGKCRLEFPNGKIYAGDIIRGVIEGYGQMFLPKVGLYKGYFKNGEFSSHGTLIISESEMYEGNFRNGVFNGHGHLQKRDHIYVGEFKNNVKCGYGVLDRLTTGEKYLGMFTDNKRMGIGICITSRGNYFEGSFLNDELCGKCVAIFPNQFYYEGEASISGPNGVGKYFMPSALPLDDTNMSALPHSSASGSILCGNLSGTWENVRIISGSIDINASLSKLPSSLAAHAVSNDAKWCSLFEDFATEVFGDLSRAQMGHGPHTATKVLWKRVMAFIDRQQTIENESLMPAELDMTPGTTCLRVKSNFWDFDKLSLSSSKSSSERTELNKSHSQSENALNGLDFSSFDLLSTFSKFAHRIHEDQDEQGNTALATLLDVMQNSETDLLNEYALGSSASSSEDTATLSREMDAVPQFGVESLLDEDLMAIKQYLKKAFNYCYHPFRHLKQRITYAFYRSYGCWKIKPTPLLAQQAMREWESISIRVYRFIQLLFPALPVEFAVVGDRREIVSHITLLYPILLSEGIYSTLFVLYANQHSRKDELYHQHLLQAEKLSDEQLLSYLEFDNDLLDVVATAKFSEAVQMLKELKEKHSPMAMLTVIENCLEQVTDAYQQITHAKDTSLNADVIMPLTLVLLLRAGIQHLGAELALLDDLTDSKNFQFEMSGIRGYCYTTLKASYEHLAGKSVSKRHCW